MPDESKKKLSLEKIPPEFIEQFIRAYVHIKKGEIEKRGDCLDITSILDELRTTAMQLADPLGRAYWMKAIDGYGQFKQLTREELAAQGINGDDN